ncbi:MAG TPA: tRNA-dihydrouridine synthase family protein [Bellilinea sp.]|nr:tRNA-dihydrouridine synthase family protein [Bellilinea sp.]
MSQSLPVKPDFHIREIPIYGRSILAPMDGVSDLPFRSLARQLGSAASYTEFINAIDIINGNPDLNRRLQYAEFERPVVFQIFDDDPQRIVEAARRLLPYRPDIIDVNLGCSAKCVTNRGAGAALLREPAKIGAIFAAMTKALPVPVTGKIRLGWDDSSLNYLEVAKTIQDNGGSLVAVHGRTRVQGYTGTARWEPIAEIKRALNIPVIANGDITTVAEMNHVLETTGADAVMIGRAALENPWIFSELERHQIPPAAVRQLLMSHYSAMLEYYGAERGNILYRKYAKRLLLPYDPERDDLTGLVTAETTQIFQQRLDFFFERYMLQPSHP